ncbi:NADH-quinone oxidoreductase subunit C [Jiangella alkaliphila]|uniref:NADH-quinone oxidoreductase subunit C n=1 Tax=Jiangella alkaliphila TaxID=419479 RepID=A0A1H2FPL0_9ACTN|nr:NADH-quinone oxidoreductase subunit C [Jiangella alkaliphila]SDU09269.1 NADH dehydrogenase subunit C [Jiangella alkaliphila]
MSENDPQSGKQDPEEVEEASRTRVETSPIDQPGKAAEPGGGPDEPSKEEVTTGGAPPDAEPEEESLPAEPEGPALPPEHPSRRGMFGAYDGSGDTSGYGRLVVRDANPVRGGSTPRPWPDELEKLGDDVSAALQEAGSTDSDAFAKVLVDRGQITFFVTREKLAEVARTFRDDPALRFELCMGVNGVHYPEETGSELHVVIQLLSITHNRRVNLEVTCPEDDPHVPSIVHTYPSANWHERETYDFFGIIFDGHPSLTRIQMPDDWPGHPQRKDYPLGGIPVEYKGATIAPPDERRAYN